MTAAAEIDTPGTFDDDDRPGLFDDDGEAGGVFDNDAPDQQTYGHLGRQTAEVETVERRTTVLRVPTTVEALRSVPTPYEALTDTDELTPIEEQHLLQGLQVIDTVDTAFWVAGKWLSVFTKAKLHRRKLGFRTFDEFVRSRGLAPSVARRMMAQWPVIERLVRDGATGLREAHGRALTEVEAVYGLDGAVELYTALATLKLRITQASLMAMLEKMNEAPQVKAGQVTVTDAVINIAATGNALGVKVIDQQGEDVPGANVALSAAHVRALEVLQQSVGHINNAARITPAVLKRAVEADPQAAEQLMKVLRDRANEIERVFVKLKVPVLPSRPELEK